MITRIVRHKVVVPLALPVAALTSCGDSHQAPWSDVAMAARGKKHQKGNKQHLSALARSRRTHASRSDGDKA